MTRHARGGKRGRHARGGKEGGMALHIGRSTKFIFSQNSVLSIRDAFWDLEVPDIAGKPPLGTCGPAYGRDYRIDTK